jgi:hypothetical protein
LGNAFLNFLLWRVIFEPAHFIMERKMPLGIRQRAERYAANDNGRTMFKKTIARMLMALLIHPAAYAALPGAQTVVGKDAQPPEKVKMEIIKRGRGRETKVSVHLRDHTKLTGFIGQIEEERFILTDAKTGAASAIAYADVTQVKGHGLSTGAKIAIGTAIGVGATVLTLWILAQALYD